MKAKDREVKTMDMYNELLRDEKMMHMGTYKDRLAEEQANQAKAEKLAAKKAKQASENQDSQQSSTGEKKAFNIKGVPIEK